MSRCEGCELRLYGGVPLGGRAADLLGLAHVANNTAAVPHCTEALLRVATG